MYNNTVFLRSFTVVPAYFFFPPISFLSFSSFFDVHPFLSREHRNFLLLLLLLFRFVLIAKCEKASGYFQGTRILEVTR